MSGVDAQSPLVIGTAGHIDHGKSTLVKTLTGTDPDRLAEEKARGMTIELGFAHATTPGGRAISFVDVPGHERFIKTMLAGVGGIDAVMLVIAADEGPMPQTDEHLAILDLLRVRSGLVTITKSDLVDRDWLDLVTEEVRERLEGTSLAGAPILPVSAATGAGIPDLLRAIDALPTAETRSLARMTPRLPVDRVFTIAGFGAVATGTLLGGELAVGQTVELLPGERAGRIRGLQVRSRPVDRATPGNRVAVNLAGLSTEDVHRGDVVALPGTLRACHVIDVRLDLLKGSPLALKQNSRVDLFTGAAESPAFITLLDRNELEPGESAWAQIRLRRPLAVLHGDRFIIRRASPSTTIGGGQVVDPSPRRHRRFQREVIESLEILATGSPADLVLQAIGKGPAEWAEVRKRLPAGLPAETARAALDELIAGDSARSAGTLFVTQSDWTRYVQVAAAAIDSYHSAYPLRPGMPREELRTALAVPGAPRVFDQIVSTLAHDVQLTVRGAIVHRPGFAIVLDPIKRATADGYLAAMRAMPYAPPAPADLGVDLQLLTALAELGEVVRITDAVVYDPAAYAAIERGVLEIIDRDGAITMGAYRDHFESSRKYAQATLEHFDQRRLTRRVGDERVRFAPAPSMEGTT